MDNEINFFDDSLVMEKKTEILQDTLTRDVKGVIWITKEALHDRPPYFVSLDYFLDGLLIRYCREGSNAPVLKNGNVQKNFFLSNHFGGPFFVGHIQIINSDANGIDQTIMDNIDQLLNLIVPIKSDSNKILLLDLTDKSNLSCSHLVKKTGPSTIISAGTMATQRYK